MHVKYSRLYTYLFYHHHEGKLWTRKFFHSVNWSKYKSKNQEGGTVEIIDKTPFKPTYDWGTAGLPKLSSRQGELFLRYFLNWNLYSARSSNQINTKSVVHQSELAWRTALQVPLHSAQSLPGFDTSSNSFSALSLPSSSKCSSCCDSLTQSHLKNHGWHRASNFSNVQIDFHIIFLERTCSGYPSYIIKTLHSIFILDLLHYYCNCVDSFQLTCVYIVNSPFYQINCRK